MILISISLFALSGKQILRVRRKVRVAKSECVLHREPYQEAPPRERRLSCFARAYMSPAAQPGTGSPDSLPNRASDPFSPEFEGLEPPAPIQSREISESDSRGVSPFATPTSPITLERSGSDQGPTRRSSSRFDRIHWKYAKFAFLCTIVLFITWVGCLLMSSSQCLPHTFSGCFWLTIYRYPSV